MRWAITEARRLVLVSLNPAYGARTRRQSNRNAKAHLLVILAPARYKCNGCSPGKSNHTRTMATGSDDDSRDSVHDRSLCIAVRRLSRREATRGEGGLLRRGGRCSGGRREGGRCKDQTPRPYDHSTPLLVAARQRAPASSHWPSLTMDTVAGDVTILEVAYRQHSRIRSSRIWVGRATSALLPDSDQTAAPR